MALQDLTPQLRTRLSRLERVVGAFVAVASLLMLAGLIYYIFRTGERKGWFVRKLPYYTFVRSAAGLKVGQPVKLMGLDVGEITEITPQRPWDYYDIYVAFRIKEPYYGYLWEDSRAHIGTVDFLGNRVIELTKGTNGPATYLFRPFREVPITEVEAFLGGEPIRFVDEVYDETRKNLLARPMELVTPALLQKIVAAGSVASLRIVDTTNHTKLPTGIWSYEDGRYLPFRRSGPESKGYFLVPDESAALTERLEKFVENVEAALPGVLNLTNQVGRVLETANLTAAHADEVLASTRPVIANLNAISSHLTNERGSLGEWLIPPHVTPQLTQTLFSANLLLTNSDARLTDLAVGLDRTLENLAGITSNLHAQVDANTNLIGRLGRLLADTDGLVQGLKRHWLLRSAFKEPKTRAPAETAPRRARSPKDER